MTESHKWAGWTVKPTELFTRLAILVTILTFLSILAFVAYLATVNWRKSKMAANEAAAIAALSTYVGAQNVYRRIDYDGDGVLEYAGPTNAQAPDFTYLHTTEVDGAKIDLINEGLAGAKLGDPNSHPYYGYFFVEIDRDVSGVPYDAERGFALCAVPADYGRTGRMTFCSSAMEGTLQRDTGGKPLTQFPERGPSLHDCGDGDYLDKNGNSWRRDGTHEDGSPRFSRIDEDGKVTYWRDYLREYNELKRRERGEPTE